ncbi:Protein SPIRAL1-like 1 [Cocos nucifera]|uniref:Protein SPIRAL1-like 1 n=1 Tax=Cocos nucifera TaxID=13894 RepID=A0A8K0N8A1_COCNU|nr:Protein SPIRAL1-like 1 [Cocos nucifera]
MSRGGSFGGGKSSLGYLFESDEPPISPSGSTKSTKSQKPPSHEGGKNMAATQENPQEKPISNNYHRAQGQNSGNFITGRPSTKVQSVPGGSSSLGYLFGDK